MFDFPWTGLSSPLRRARRPLHALAVVAAVAVLLAAMSCRQSPYEAAPESIPVDDLAPLWEVWDILQDGFVDRDTMDPQSLSLGAVEEMARATSDAEDDAASLEPDPRYSLPDGAPEELAYVWDAWTAVFQRAESQGTTAPDPPEIAQAAIRGLIGALGDEHTTYVSPDRFAIEAQAFDGRYEGIGSEVYNRGGVFLLSPMPNSPAEEAGIRAGDALVTVEGESVAGWTIHRLVSVVRGPAGTPIALGIRHLGSTEVVEIVVTRGRISLESASWTMLQDDIAYLRLRAFYENSDEAMQQILREIQGQGVRGVVLDLRNNPGGLLSTSAHITALFLEEGLVVYEQGTSTERSDWTVKEDGLARDLPIVVLVNQFSASGSEILAGALQDHDRAPLVGVRTFGKGSVNRLQGLSDGGGLYYTSERWYTPNGRLIEAEGLEPDVVVPGPVEFGGSQADPQLDRAVDLLRAQIRPRAATPAAGVGG